MPSKSVSPLFRMDGKAVGRQTGAVNTTKRDSELTLSFIPAKKTNSFSSMRRDLLAAVAIAVLFGGGIAALLTQTVIAGAVVTHGVLVVESGSKLVQHPTGGIVSAVLVNEGDHVTAGQPLLELDETVAGAQLAVVRTNLAQQQARLARLMAERDNLDEPDFSSVRTDTGLQAAQREAILQSELTQFELRGEEREGQRNQLRERIRQAEEEIAGQNAQLDALRADVALVEAEAENMRELYSKKLIPYQRLYDMERTLSQSKGQEGALVAGIAATQGRIAEMELAIIQVDQTLRSQLTNEIAAAQTSTGELAEQFVIAQTTMTQSTIVAPQTGRVLRLQVKTVGGVIQPAEVLMTIVPDTDTLVGEVRISPNDVDQLYPGQPVTIQFSAFDRGTTPAINGRLEEVSADLVRDEATGAMFYTARIATDEQSMTQLKDLSLVPGMPIEVFVKTGDRTIISYLTKPITDQVNRAFR